MALINKEIQEQSFELIRDRIAEILSIEITNQYNLFNNEDLNLKVWLERNTPFNHSELPSINVSLSEGIFDQNTTTRSDGTYTYFIDVYHKGKTDENESGYLKSNRSNQRVLGVVRYILEDPQYKRLGFAPGFIGGRNVRNFQISEPTNSQDSTSITMSRIVFEVRSTEVEELLDAEIIKSAITSLTLNETDEGYYYEYDNN
ncbi:MAG: hypothetical protein ACPGSO_00600 [Vicingaceae bacterium]